MYQNSLARCPFVVPYTTGRAHAGRSPSTFETWLDRPITFHFMGQYDTRRGYGLRRLVAKVFEKKLVNSTAIFTTSTKHNDTEDFYKPCDFKDCLPKHRCIRCHVSDEQKNQYASICERSKFSLMLHGDTASSRRLYEAFMYDQVPVILSNELMQYGLPFLQYVPWKDVAFFVHSKKLNVFEAEDDDSEERFEEIAVQLKAIQNAPRWLWKQKFDNMQKYKKDVLWNVEGSRVTQNVIRTVADRCL